ncbi:hypothetical protein FA09DRAFT_359178, partial [Tilletiopsis washingtonensis]
MLCTPSLLHPTRAHRIGNGQRSAVAPSRAVGSMTCLPPSAGGAWRAHKSQHPSPSLLSPRIQSSLPLSPSSSSPSLGPALPPSTPTRHSTLPHSRKPCSSSVSPCSPACWLLPRPKYRPACPSTCLPVCPPACLAAATAPRARQPSPSRRCAPPLPPPRLLRHCRCAGKARAGTGPRAATTTTTTTARRTTATATTATTTTTAMTTTMMTTAACAGALRTQRRAAALTPTSRATQHRRACRRSSTTTRATATGTTAPSRSARRSASRSARVHSSVLPCCS